MIRVVLRTGDVRSWALLVAIVCMVSGTYPVIGQAEELWPDESVLSGCCDIAEGMADDVRIVRTGGHQGVSDGAQEISLSIRITIPENIEASVTHSEIDLIFYHPGTYRHWLTVLCLKSNVNWRWGDEAFFDVTALERTNRGITEGMEVSIHSDIFTYWRLDGGEWQSGRPPQDMEFSSCCLQIVFLQEITVTEITGEPFEETVEIAITTGVF